MSETAVELIQAIQKNVSSDPLSKLLQVLILLAKEVNDSECERWAKLESNGYHKDNPALLEGDKIPSYRNVVGYYVDRFGRTVTVNQPEPGQPLLIGQSLFFVE
ncbi:AbiTii domain-containing protein [Alicyclobacillus suci]|uniref:AbiTii domain-containing protein n=1 Tax=Alicyclobacillus suci TaxID=2816080 RepID=UPI001A8CB31D|nr:hypothetical protein [Alicyclobacillus suci]